MKKLKMLEKSKVIEKLHSVKLEDSLLQKYIEDFIHVNSIFEQIKKETILEGIHKDVAKLIAISKETDATQLARKLLAISYQLLTTKTKESKHEDVQQLGYYLQKIALSSNASDLHEMIGS